MSMRNIYVCICISRICMCVCACVFGTNEIALLFSFCVGIHCIVSFVFFSGNINTESNRTNIKFINDI